MALTGAERQRVRRARLKAGITLPTCSSCGARLLPDIRERADRQDDGTCWSCWLKTPAGLEAERERGARQRAKNPEQTRALTRARVRRSRDKARRGDT
jgi:hypothetical protein